MVGFVKHCLYNRYSYPVVTRHYSFPGFNRLKVLKGKIQIAGGNLLFRNTLVVMQFVVGHHPLLAGYCRGIPATEFH
jgi:hypothetical protein